MPSKQNRASTSVSSQAPVTVTVTAVTASFKEDTLVAREYLKRRERCDV